MLLERSEKINNMGKGVLITMEMTPLYKAVSNYVNKKMTRFHVPGHKGQGLFITEDLWKYDVTEIEGLDNLLNSSGVIKQTEDNYKELYKTEASVITTQGSTLGVQMMITAAFMSRQWRSKKIIIDRNSHISAINTMALLGLEPIWLLADGIDNYFMPSKISPESVEKAILANPDADVIYITSPTYFGLMMDLKEIAKICDKHDKILLVDNAHGAHLKFVSKGLHPMDCGCTCCCDSLHKTLPVLTGGALVHTKDPLIAQYLKKAQMLYASTSPSYMTMLTIDTLVPYLKTHAAIDLDFLISRVNEMKTLARSIGLDVPRGDSDPIRLVIGPGKLRCSAEKIAEVLRQYKIEPEHVDAYWVVMIMSPQNTDDDFARLKEAITYMGKNFLEGIKKSQIVDSYRFTSLNQCISIREAMLSKSIRVNTVKSNNMVAAQAIVQSTPCIPILVPGQFITKEVVELLTANKICSLEVVDM